MAIKAGLCLLPFDALLIYEFVTVVDILLKVAVPRVVPSLRCRIWSGISAILVALAFQLLYVSIDL